VAKLIIDGKPYDVPASFTLGEARTIRRIAGVPLAGLQEALEAAEPDAIAALVLVVLQREDPAVTEEVVNRIDVGAVTEERDASDVELEKAEAEIEEALGPRPPASRTRSGGTPSGPEPTPASELAGSSSETTPAASGLPASVTSSG